MPSVLEPSSWADEVCAEEEGKLIIPPPTEEHRNGMKICTEYRINDDEKLEKIVRVYRTEKQRVFKSVALRKGWSKFGDSKDDKPGPNPATTNLAEEVKIQLITSEEDKDKTDDSLDKLKAANKTAIKCRVCEGDHFTTGCPYKDSISKIDEKIPTVANPATESATESSSGYVIPANRAQANSAVRRGETVNRHGDSACAIRISNLSANASDNDLEELVKPFGAYSKLYLAKDKVTAVCRGFAYVHFRNRQDAATAISKLNGHGYDHLILKADWSKSTNTQ